MKLRVRADRKTKTLYEVKEFVGEHNHTERNYIVEEVCIFLHKKEIIMSNLS